MIFIRAFRWRQVFACLILCGRGSTLLLWTGRCKVTRLTILCWLMKSVILIQVAIQWNRTKVKMKITYFNRMKRLQLKHRLILYKWRQQTAHMINTISLYNSRIVYNCIKHQDQPSMRTMIIRALSC